MLRMAVYKYYTDFVEMPNVVINCVIGFPDYD